MQNQQFQKTVRQRAILWHRRLTWPALIALVLFVVSGISHPLMVWTGPQTQKFFAPKLQYQAEHWHTLQTIAKNNSQQQAALLKLVPSEQGAVIQLTPNTLEARRYFDANTAVELVDYDLKQAQWLARYYSGEQNASIKNNTLITEFNHQYPSVNRQLPVWKIEFNRDDNLSVYIHTESLTAAAINNDWKRSLQSLFQYLHTQSLLGDTPWLQFAAMNLLMLILIIFSLSGVIMVWAIPKRKHIPSSKRRWHRRSAIIIYVPLLLFLFSGFYHLWYSQLANTTNDKSLKTPIDLALIANTEVQGLNNLVNKTFNQLSVVNDGHGNVFLRVNTSPKSSPTINREQRFKGQAKEETVHYLPLGSQNATMNDQYFAALLVQQALSPEESIQAISPVRHFGNGYDFRNKRLPVWRVETNQHWYFVDSSTGLLIEQVDTARRYEGLSFSILHKWNLLVPAIGRQWRDVAIITCLSLLLVLAALGLAIKLKRAKKYPTTA